MSVPEKIITIIWNALLQHRRSEGLKLGNLVKDGLVSRHKVSIPHFKRPEHIAVIGKTGTGKSSLLRFMMSQDIRARRGFACIDLHGDLIPFVLAELAAVEHATGRDLSHRLLLIDPADPLYAVGLNLIECDSDRSRPVQISEMVSLLRKRWSLDHFGARTEELLRNTFWTLSENGLTLLEVAPLLTNSGYRASLVARVRNPEIRRYFEERYDAASSAMQAVMREAVLNKIGAFTVDPAIRHIVGQKKSSIPLVSAIDSSMFACISLQKGNLGENALTFASLILAKFKAAIFTRQKRSLFTLYADELPNLAALNDTFEVLLSEARKLAISVVSANQFLGQLSPQMKAALLSVGTLLSFEPSSEDALTIARALGGDRSLARNLVSLPHRHLIARFGERVYEAAVPNVKKHAISAVSLTSRSNARWASRRNQIEEQINARIPKPSTTELEGWD